MFRNHGLCSIRGIAGNGQYFPLDLDIPIEGSELKLENTGKRSADELDPASWRRLFQYVYSLVRNKAEAEDLTGRVRRAIPRTSGRTTCRKDRRMDADCCRAHGLQAPSQNDVPTCIFHSILSGQMNIQIAFSSKIHPLLQKGK